MLRAQRKFQDAEPLYERSLAIDEKVYGPDHPEVATDLNNWAALYEVQVRAKMYFFGGLHMRCWIVSMLAILCRPPRAKVGAFLFLRGFVLR